MTTSHKGMTTMLGISANLPLVLIHTLRHVSHLDKVERSLLHPFQISNAESLRALIKQLQSGLISCLVIAYDMGVVSQMLERANFSRTSNFPETPSVEGQYRMDVGQPGKYRRYAVEQQTPQIR
jgi:hypothetical protein